MTTFLSSDDATPAPVVPTEEVEREIAGGFRSLRFSPALEGAYERDRRAERMRYMDYCVVIAICIYDAFLVSDWKLLRDVFWESCVYRLAVFTPLAVLCTLVIRRYPIRQLREGLWSLMGVVAVALMMKTFADSASPYVPSYCYGTVLVMIYSVVVQRGPIRYAAASCAAMVVIQLVAVRSSPLIDEEVFGANVTFFISAALLLLSVAYALEREGRMGYLLALRSRLLNERLDLTAKVDPLTGLWNRRHLDAVMNAAWSGPAGEPMAVVLIDVDYFKRFNDTCGHMAGDVCLQRVAAALSTTLDAGRDVAVRFGGEEFLVFLPGRDEGAAAFVAERLRRAVNREAMPHPGLGAQMIVTASFGVAACPAGVGTTQALVAAADKALYRAKAEGRDCVRTRTGETARPIDEPWPMRSSA